MLIPADERERVSKKVTLVNDSIVQLRSALGELVDAADACTVRFADKVDERLATALARAITVLDSCP